MTNNTLRQTRFDGHTPKKPHLIFYHATGQAAAFEPGSVIGIVENPMSRSPFWRMAIKEVSENKLVFRCTCNPSCNVEWVYRMNYHGKHTR